MAMSYVLADYIWIDGIGSLRSKTRVIYKSVKLLADIDEWNFDGSSTEQAEGHASEVFLRPIKMVKCPFRRTDNAFIVLCETYLQSGQPAKWNHRAEAAKVFEKYAEAKSLFGIEQEFFAFDCDTNKPFFFDENGKQGQYYCSVGGKNAFMRDLSEEHLHACLYAGIKLTGTNAEVAPSQWEYQVLGEGIDAADQLWLSRYILEKLSEKYNAYIIYYPKPLKGDWNGSGKHVNCSIESMRTGNGFEIIKSLMPKFEARHEEFMKITGEHNRDRMQGSHETSQYDKFTWGVGSRNTSIRVPNDAVKGINCYFEHRGPGANADPYQVTSKILEIMME